MSGLTQADVTPNAVEEEEQEEQQDKGYQFGRWFSNPGNELRFLGNKVRDGLEAAAQLNSSVTKRGRVGVLKLYATEGDDGILKPGPLPTQKNIPAGIQEAVVDVGLQGISLAQQSTENLAATVQGREPEQTDVGDTAVGRLLMDSKDATARALGIPERIDLTEDNRWLRDLPSVTTSGYLAAMGLRRLGLTPGQNPTLLTGTRVNPFASPTGLGNLVNIKGPWGAFWRGSGAGRNFARGALKWGLFGAAESGTTTLISNQTESGYADPSDSLWTAAVKSVPGNMFEDLTFGSIIGGTGYGISKILQAPSSIARARRAAKTTQDVKNARQWTTDNGLQTENADGSYEFTTDRPYDVDLGDGQGQVDTTPKTPREALDLLEDGWDPAQPEIDTVKRGLDRVDPSELPNIATEVAEGTPVTEAVGQRLDAPEAVPTDVEIGPPINLPPEVVSAMVMGFDVPTLRVMAQSNPTVARLLRAMGETPLTATRTELADAISDASAKGEPIAAPTKVPETTADPGQADVLKAQILREAVDSGQVRPSATEIPEIPEPPAKDPSDMTAMEQLIEEDRLQGEWTQIDNAKAEQDARAIREADGYYQKSEAEQAAAGKYDGWDEPAAPEPALAEPTQQFTLPADVSKSAPRFGMAKLTFASDLDRAAYIIRNKAKASKGEARIIKALEEQGYDIAEIRARGDEVKTLIQDVIEEQTGSRRAPQSAMELEIPDKDTIRDPDAMMSAGGPQLPPIDDWSKIKGPDDLGPEWRAEFEAWANNRVNNIQTELRGIAEQIFGKDEIPAFDFNKGPAAPQLLPRAWGGDGKKMATRGGLYEPLRDVIEVNELLNKKLEGSYGLREVMAHESWHRIQAGYLTPKQSKVLNSVFGKQDLNVLTDFNPYQLRTVQPIEIQATAFQKFYTMRETGVARMDQLRDGITEMLDQQFPKKRGSWKKSLTVEALTVIAEGWERILQFRNRAMNYIEGNGFQNVYDIFEEAYQGRLTAGRKMESFAQVLREAERIPDMSPEEFGRWVKENPDFERKYIDAGVRRDYWKLWEGKANKTIAKLDSDIAALKQQAIDGGC